MLKSIVFADLVRLFQVRDDLKLCTLAALCEIWLRGSLGCKIGDDR